MHASVMDFLARALSLDEVTGGHVLEVGSFNVNGTARKVIEPMSPLSYTGVDVRPGLGVDVVLDACDLFGKYGADAFDVVVSTEMLEHVMDWRGALVNMQVVCRPGGVLVLTVRGPGFPYHEPPDYHRFTKERLVAEFPPGKWQIEMLEDDPQIAHPGVFLKARKGVGVELCASYLSIRDMAIPQRT